MSLHDDGDDGIGGCLVFLPWYIGLPLLVLLLVAWIGYEIHVQRQLPTWQITATFDASKWAVRAWGEDAAVLACRHDAGSVFHCNARTSSGVHAFDCDGANGDCEICNE
ncbi:MAG: hypothetical protein Q8S13_10750 [Dehalococcoidia bacterium]|nr:hypothetical protein [Dehalococcoidia bacterium]